MPHYIDNPNVWAPQDCAGILAVLTPSQLQTIDSEAVYLRLLQTRLEWLLRERQLQAKPTLSPAHALLQQSLLLLNPKTPIPPAQPLTSGQSSRPWRQAWAKAIVEDSGAVHTLLAATGTRFPQPVVSVGRRGTLLRLFEASACYSLEDWLGDLVYVYTR